MTKLCIPFQILCGLSLAIVGFNAIPTIAVAGDPQIPAAQVDDAIVTIDNIPLRVATGFTVTKVAGEPLVKWPVVADWDSEGRLVVVESAGVSRPIDVHNEQRLHRVIRLRDTNGDGVFDERTVAADQLPFAEGVLCLGQDLLVSAPPLIYRLTDQDGDGVCEQRSVWFDGQTITGCANDLHGPYLGRDGWVYWCKGAFAEQNHSLLEGGTLISSAAHIFRRRLAGGPIEPVVTGGMDNPVELAILPTGERFFTSTFLQHPGNGLRDGITHGVYGGVYGKDHAVIEGHRRTGPLMPITIQLGAAAPSGLASVDSHVLQSTLFGSQGDTLVAALFNLHKVTAHRMHEDGAAYRADTLDVLSSTRVDFHPTDVLEDGQGGLIVVDTGGWYDLCCPSSRVDQKTAPGGIYRISLTVPKSDNHQIAISDAIAATPSNLQTFLHRAAFGGPVEARNSAASLILLGDNSIAELNKIVLDDQAALRLRIEAVWALCRLDSNEANQTLNVLLNDAEMPSEVLRVVAHAIGLHRHQPSASKLASLLGQTTDHATLRAIAEALGRLKNSATLPALMSAFSNVANDRVLEHSLLYAMIEINDVDRVLTYLDDNSPQARRAALIVVSQLRPEEIDFERLLSITTDTDSAVANEALAMLARGQVATPSVADIQSVEALWSAAPENAVARSAIKSLISGFGDSEIVHTWVAQWISETNMSDPLQVDALLTALRGYKGAEVPSSWREPLAQWVRVCQAETLYPLVDWLRPLTANLSHDAPLVQALWHRILSSSDDQLCVTSLSALPLRFVSNDERVSSLLVAYLLSNDSAERRSLAELALRRVIISGEAARTLLERLDEVEALSLSTVITSLVIQPGTVPTAECLAAIEQHRAARTLPPHILQQAFAKHDVEVRQRVEELCQRLQRAPRDVRTHVESVLSSLPPGDALKGLEVFRGAKAACSACHRMGYVGAEVGPDLSSIGGSRTRYDILEAVLFPNARLEQSYQPMRVLTIDGRVYSGLIKEQTANRLVLVTGANQSVTLDPEEIESKELSETSIMPSGLADQLTPQELADLLELMSPSK